jgi:hypothetical protein
VLKTVDCFYAEVLLDHSGSDALFKTTNKDASFELIFLLFLLILESWVGGPHGETERRRLHEGVMSRRVHAWEVGRWPHGEGRVTQLLIHISC